MDHWFDTFSISGSKWLDKIVQNHEGRTFIQNWVEKWNQIISLMPLTREIPYIC